MRNALTVDVEEYFQVAAFERTIPRKAWESAESRVEFNTGRVLDLFADRGWKAGVNAPCGIPGLSSEGLWHVV